MAIRAPFRVHMLNETGWNKAAQIASIFDGALERLEMLCAPGRELAIVTTKLEEACFFAKKAMANDPVNGELDASFGLPGAAIPAESFVHPDVKLVAPPHDPTPDAGSLTASTQPCALHDGVVHDDGLPCR